MRLSLIALVLLLTGAAFVAALRLVPAGIESQVSASAAEIAAQQVATDPDVTTQVATLTQTISGLEGQIDELSSANQALTAERDQISADLAQTRGTLEGIETQQGELSQSNADLVATADALRADVAAREDELAAAEVTIETLNSTIAANSAEIEGLTAQITDLQSLSDTLTARVAELESEPVAAPAIDDNQTQAQIADLQAEVEQSTTALDESRAALQQAEQTIADLTAAAEAEAAMAAEAEQAIAEATDTTAEFETQIAALNTQVAELTQTLSERDRAIAALAETSQPAASTQQQEAIAALNSQIAELTQDLSERDRAIAALAASSVAPDVQDEQPAEESQEAQAAEPTSQSPVALAAEICTTRTNAFLAETTIGFQTGTTAIAAESVAALEGLAAIASDCAAIGLVLEVGGHTDSLGGEASNLALSEARAAAVESFLQERGINPDAILSVGYGESEPIADNGTSAGREANRRITFEWQVQ